jgi:hypothetical protein
MVGCQVGCAGEPRINLRLISLPATHAMGPVRQIAPPGAKAIRNPFIGAADKPRRSKTSDATRKISTKVTCPADGRTGPG